MGLEDFEKELAASKASKSSHKKRDRSRSRDRSHRHRRDRSKDREHRRDHRSSRHHHRDEDDERSGHRDDRHRHKRSRHHRDRSQEDSHRRRSHRDGDRDEDDRRDKPRRRHADSSDDEQERIGRKGKGALDDEDMDTDSEDEAPPGRDFVPPDDDILDRQLEEAANANIERDSWMQAPSSLDVDYVQRKKKEEKTTYVKSSEEHFKPTNVDEPDEQNVEESGPREVSYTFGDAGSQWRMMKLKGIYRAAEETNRSVEEVALEKYGDLQDFDDAREEEIEMDRKKMYGKAYVGKEKPSGELYEERKRKESAQRQHEQQESGMSAFNQTTAEASTTAAPPPQVRLSSTELNKLKAQMMKAKMKGAPNAKQLEDEYNAYLAADKVDPGDVVLSAMDNRMLAGGRKGEVVALTNKRGQERGLVKENEDMSIEDMVRQERRTKGQAGGEGMLLAEKIAKDAKFDNDLDYLDENASRLATRAPKSTINLRNTAIQDYQRTNRILDSCQLCHHEDRSPPQPPIAPILSLATRVYLTLPTEPELSAGGAVIVPTQHRTNLLECDDDEWEEIRNFMKCLTRMYHDQGRDVIFYENAAAPHRKLHAAMSAVPIPFELGETAPAFFREAILASDDEWTQHKPLIDTLKASRNGMGRSAFRKSLAKEMPYFHVWFELDGGLGHVVEDERRWPRGDLFARETLGGMLDADIEVVKRQGRWHKEDRRVEKWKKGWRKFDWTRVLSEG
ncbi:hypothetical protein BU24DRAFT_447418 [Aaosphaeria arxii CBS 175.79]|uniref:Cell cycle control protein cwf19 n=1 Tax=Aaosphaeria arxii CBS 175.79 TaxID=1450172 RepID=A0A6A5Y0M6_9PLEO|nr:uncharacterized protein BU24DRAFT_447418 [Aaosphaeria arxii CBS 175.79]KAF2018786.1 hypothetical protein BU24DRAFT_447418 [Aaosphaeria arxii CBS 175.79]